MKREDWERFKEQTVAAGFNTRRFDDEKMELKRSDDIFRMKNVEGYLSKEVLETGSYEDIMYAAESYVKEYVKPQFVNDEGEDDWYDETFEMWCDAFEYTALFYRCIDFSVSLIYEETVA